MSDEEKEKEEEKKLLEPERLLGDAVSGAKRGPGGIHPAERTLEDEIADDPFSLA